MKNALIVSVLALLPLGIHASAQSEPGIELIVTPTLVTTAQDAAQDAAQEHVPYHQTAVVERAQLQHMSAEDFASLVRLHFSGYLRVHIEYHRNGVLLSGEAETVKQALAIAAKLDVAAPVQEADE